MLLYIKAQARVHLGADKIIKRMPFRHNTANVRFSGCRSVLGQKNPPPQKRIQDHHSQKYVYVIISDNQDQIPTLCGQYAEKFARVLIRFKIYFVVCTQQCLLVYILIDCEVYACIYDLLYRFFLLLFFLSNIVFILRRQLIKLYMVLYELERELLQ